MELFGDPPAQSDVVNGTGATVYEITDGLESAPGEDDLASSLGRHLYELLMKWLGCRFFCVKPELHCVHERQAAPQEGVSSLNALQRAKEHVEEPQEQRAKRTIKVFICKDHAPVCIVLVHMYEIKGSAGTDIAEALLKHLGEICASRACTV